MNDTNRAMPASHLGGKLLNVLPMLLLFSLGFVLGMTYNSKFPNFYLPFAAPLPSPPPPPPRPQAASMAVSRDRNPRPRRRIVALSFFFPARSSPLLGTVVVMIFSVGSWVSFSSLLVCAWFSPSLSQPPCVSARGAQVLLARGVAVRAARE
ncbi:unnamed protein product [Urochloa humidicola]